LRKVEDDLHLKEKLLEAREKRLREMEIELISCGSKLAVNQSIKLFLQINSL
jgi:hypothetical protein